MSSFLIPFGRALLSGIGLVWLFLEAYYGLGPPDIQKLSFFPFLCFGLMVGGVWFIVDGIAVAGFLKRSISISSNALDTSITVMFGDIFTMDGCKAISVNDFFDSVVDEKHVASNTLHGRMLTRCWAGNTSDWDAQISKDLSNTMPVEVVNRLAPGKSNRFAVGTTAYVSIMANEFLCVALTRTCTKTMETSANSDDLQHAVRGLLSKARTVCAGQPLNIPLIGSGLARTGIKPNIIIHLVLLAIFEESRDRKVTNNIRIVLPAALKNRIDLSTIQKDWR